MKHHRTGTASVHRCHRLAHPRFKCRCLLAWRLGVHRLLPDSQALNSASTTARTNMDVVSLVSPSVTPIGLVSQPGCSMCLSCPTTTTISLLSVTMEGHLPEKGKATHGGLNTMAAISAVCFRSLRELRAAPLLIAIVRILCCCRAPRSAAGAYHASVGLRVRWAFIILLLQAVLVCVGVLTWTQRLWLWFQTPRPTSTARRLCLARCCQASAEHCAGLGWSWRRCLRGCNGCLQA